MRQPRSGKPVIDSDWRLAEAACSGSLEAPTAARCGDKRQDLSVQFVGGAIPRTGAIDAEYCRGNDWVR